MSTGKLKKSDVIFEKYPEMYTILDGVFKKDNKTIIDDLISSGLRGRGGAGFPVGMKWKLTGDQKSDMKYVICNADEGEPGTFKDREILLQVPRKVLTGMAICAKVIGSKKGYIYLRNEYRFMVPHLEKHLDIFHKHLKEVKFDFNVEIFLGSGAYVCGEETALMESMEGHRGEPRNKPPYPGQVGLHGKPTVINNVESFANVSIIYKKGLDFYKNLGTKDSRGSKLFSISGDTPKPGVYELELGMSLDTFVEEFGDGDTKAVQVGGASGLCVPRRKFKETIIGFEGVPTGGSIILFNNSRSMYNVLRNYLEFFQEESCGQCTPCRIGCQQLVKGIEAIKKGEKSPEYITNLEKLTNTMQVAAKCGLGRSVGNSFYSIVENFREEMIY